MVANKNALHEVIMNYIPTKKKMDTPIQPPPAIFKGPIPVLGQPASVQSDSITTKPIVSTSTPSISMSKEKVTIIKKDSSNVTQDQNVVKKPLEPVVEEATQEAGSKSRSSKNKKSVKRNRGGSSKKRNVKALNGPSVLEQILAKKEKHDFIDKIIEKNGGSSRQKSRSRVQSKRKDYKKGDFIGIESFDVEPKIHKNPFRDVEVKIKGSGKNSKKKSKSNSKKKSKKSLKRRSSKSTIRIKQNAPSYLKQDIEKLLGKDNSMAFHHIFN